MKRQQGYFTVEAALVLPVTISAMLFGIYLFCFQYDRCLLDQDMGYLLIWSSMTADRQDNIQDAENLMKRKAAELYQDKYVSWRMTEIDIRLENNQICAAGSGELLFPAPRWNIWNGDNTWEAKTFCQKSRLSPVFYIRQFNKIKELAQKQNDRP